MIKRRTVIAPVLIVMAVLTGNVSVAQRLGCPEAEFQQFDFWIGEWSVTDNVSGNFAGTNSIKAMEGGCMLLESWQGASGGTGTSVNYYNPLNKQWRQLWVSQGRYSIDIVGALVGESMRLEGSIYPFSGAAARFRGTWTPNPDGSVRQFFEQYDEATGVWAVWFDGRYESKE